MNGMRPGTRVPLWSPKFPNRPDVEPPALLRLVAALSVFSVVGVLGKIEVDPATRLAACVAAGIAVLSWLYASPRMRFYYAALAGKRTPDDLVGHEKDLAGGARLHPQLQRLVEWFLDNGETLVLVGFMLLAFYVVLSTSI